MNQDPYHILPLLLNIFQTLSTKWDFSLFESLSDFFMSHLFNCICLVGVHTVNMFSTCVWNWSPWRGDKALLAFLSYLKPTAVLKMESSFLSSTPQFQIHVKGCENSIFSVSISVENKMIDSIPNWSTRLKKKKWLETRFQSFTLMSTLIVLKNWAWRDKRRELFEEICWTGVSSPYSFMLSERGWGILINGRIRGLAVDPCLRNGRWPMFVVEATYLIGE